MTILEYLRSSEALEKIRLLLADHHSRIGIGEDVGLLGIDPCGAWMRVRLAYTKDGISVYYRLTPPGYIVSDSGDSVSGIMRRTGRSWAESTSRAIDAVGDRVLLHGNGDADISFPRAVDEAWLPEILIRVLTAVAACAEVGV